jgi:hypothetical protein
MSGIDARAPRRNKKDAHWPDGEEQHPQTPLQLRLMSLKLIATSGNAYQHRYMVTRVLEQFPEPGGASSPTDKASGLLTR